MKTQIEQVREKMIQQESKKKKKATSTVNSGKKTTINLKMGNYSKDNFSFPRTLTNQAKVQEGQENNIKKQWYTAKQLRGIKRGVGDHKKEERMNSATL